MVQVTLVLLLVVTDGREYIACGGKLSFDNFALFDITVQIVLGLATAVFLIFNISLDGSGSMVYYHL